MSVLTTLRKALRDLPGGIAKAAKRMDLSESTLYNKLNDECLSHKLYHEEFREAAHPDFCKSTAPIQALCNEFGGVFVQTMVSADLPAHALMEKLPAIAKELSDFLGAVSEGAFDNNVDDGELARIEREFHEFTAIGAQAVHKARAMNAAYHERMAEVRAEAEAAAKAARRAMAGLRK